MIVTPTFRHKLKSKNKLIETSIKNKLLNNPSITSKEICEDEQLYKNLKKWLKEEVSEKRHYTHSKSAAKWAEKLAVAFNEAPFDAKLAGLLHDCGKTAPGREPHGLIGAESLVNNLGFNNHKILTAIEKHSFYNKRNTKFEKLIFLADKTDPEKRDKTIYQETKKLINQGYSIDRIVKELELG